MKSSFWWPVYESSDMCYRYHCFRRRLLNLVPYAVQVNKEEYKGEIRSKECNKGLRLKKYVDKFALEDLVNKQRIVLQQASTATVISERIFIVSIRRKESFSKKYLARTKHPTSSATVIQCVPINDWTRGVRTFPPKSGILRISLQSEAIQAFWFKQSKMFER
ncbi:hypothetical protein KM043_018408 [Ampulex compressa]|nr:hypothetical protein KM043_018408 [Ampulex compressa]